MRLLAKIVLAIAINLVGLLVAEYFVPGFLLATGDLQTLLILTLVLTGLNYVLKPILKLLLGPIIVLTLGLGAILVNALILQLLDILSPALSIQGLVALLLATIIISIVNFIFHLATRK
jgi:putative membrane protein